MSTGVISQDVNFVMTLRDAQGTRVGFLHLRYRALGEHVQLQQPRDEPVTGCELAVPAACLYRARPGRTPGLDLGATWTAIVNWYNQNEQTINEVVQVVGEIAAAVAS